MNRGLRNLFLSYGDIVSLEADGDTWLGTQHFAARVGENESLLRKARRLSADNHGVRKLQAVITALNLPRFGGQLHYELIAVTCVLNSNSIGLT